MPTVKYTPEQIKAYEQRSAAAKRNWQNFRNALKRKSENEITQADLTEERRLKDIRNKAAQIERKVKKGQPIEIDMPPPSSKVPKDVRAQKVRVKYTPEQVNAYHQSFLVAKSDLQKFQYALQRKDSNNIGPADRAELQRLQDSRTQAQKIWRRVQKEQPVDTPPPSAQELADRRVRAPVVDYAPEQIAAYGQDYRIARGNLQKFQYALNQKDSNEITKADLAETKRLEDIRTQAQRIWRRVTQGKPVDTPPQNIRGAEDLSAQERRVEYTPEQVAAYDQAHQQAKNNLQRFQAGLKPKNPEDVSKAELAEEQRLKDLRNVAQKNARRAHAGREVDALPQNPPAVETLGAMAPGTVTDQELQNVKLTPEQARIRQDYLEIVKQLRDAKRELRSMNNQRRRKSTVQTLRQQRREVFQLEQVYGQQRARWREVRDAVLRDVRSGKGKNGELTDAETSSGVQSTPPSSARQDQGDPERDGPHSFKFATLPSGIRSVGHQLHQNIKRVSRQISAQGPPFMQGVGRNLEHAILISSAQRPFPPGFESRLRGLAGLRPAI